ncbi:hypothetical protein BDZ91DRAFT_709311 [Kalaharituber pfeilii]|nr:hypothetical protein BDZ91DRAFT_709311 [Kalaharituber pfeilii]
MGPRMPQSLFGNRLRPPSARSYRLFPQQRSYCRLPAGPPAKSYIHSNPSRPAIHISLCFLPAVEFLAFTFLLPVLRVYIIA